MDNILEIKNLHTYFYTSEGTVKAVEGVTFDVRRGEILGLVGESACGKTVTAYSVLKLVNPPGKIVQGTIAYGGRDILTMSDRELERLRGSKLAMVFQEPSMALNPLYTLGFQIVEAIAAHQPHLSRPQRRRRAIELLAKVGIPSPEVRMNDYPHQVSGGQAQRAMIAMALACSPQLLIADEPTTSLDVTIQAQIMDLFMDLQEEQRFSLILITHNLALCARVADRLAIMYAGRIVELGPTDVIFAQALHPYTRALFSSIPHGNHPKAQLRAIAGTVPQPDSKPSGCHFHPRCPHAQDICAREYPLYRESALDHWAACHFAGKLA